MGVAKLKYAFILNDKKNIVPIVEGAMLRIYDTTLEVVTDYPNPYRLTKNAEEQFVYNFAQMHGSCYFVVPKSVQPQYSFNHTYLVEEGTTFEQFKTTIK